MTQNRAITLTQILHHSQQAIFQASRSSHSPALNWKFGLTVRSPLKGTESQFQNLESRLPDFAPLAPTSSPARGSAIVEMPRMRSYRNWCKI
ncbi:hypothetical protein ACQ4M3_13565 [Leptolyngbya sp. AN03gr2]|uniref:hypothetical protein n=1 Tax=unclassified Leptolyngbya TaxID=2650499 RepID=UPI003D31CCCF